MRHASNHRSEPNGPEGAWSRGSVCGLHKGGQEGKDILCVGCGSSVRHEALIKSTLSAFRLQKSREEHRPFCPVEKQPMHTRCGEITGRVCQPDTERCC